MEIGTVHTVDIAHEMRSAYLDYAMSVIVARALPDVRDGLKPVQRRILYAMYDMGLRPESPYKKSARIVGEVLGKYHPHGDIAVYESMARMAQDFSLRYPLIDGQGNFGSVDGDNPAAMRYTEARLSRIALELLLDIEKDTVEWVDNFDGTLREPAVLPARFPNLLVNGCSGIAVGMATNIPPHNLGEICDALCFVIDRWDELEDITVEDLLRYVEGPDFPTGGAIVGREGILQAYATGQGRILVRAIAHIEEIAGNRHRIVITELPYQTNKAALLARIAELVREGRLPDIADLRDESDKRGLSIVIELKRGAQPSETLRELYKHTALQTTFGVQMLALVDGEPRLLSLKRMLQLYIEHRAQVLTRRTRHELERAQQRAHILEGLKIALDHLDKVIRTIREAPDAETARGRLIEYFGLSEAQAQAILDMQLRRLAALERQKIEDEYLELIQRIAYLEDLLASPRKILYLIKVETEELKKAHGDGRRTRILAEAGSVEMEEADKIWCSISLRGLIVRMPAELAETVSMSERTVRRLPARMSSATGVDDPALFRLLATSRDMLLFFSSQGKVYAERVYQVPDAAHAPGGNANPAGRGVPLTTLLACDADERIVAVIPVPSFEVAGHIVLATRLGRVKRLSLAELSAVRAGGTPVIGLERGDELAWAMLELDGHELIIVTEDGYVLRFQSASVRPMGRTAAGVNAVKLREGDRIACVCAVMPQSELLIVTTRGYGKRIPLGEFNVKGRYSKGVRCLPNPTKAVGKVASARLVLPTDTVMIVSKEGLSWRIPVKLIPLSERQTRAVQIVELPSDDEIVSVTVHSYPVMVEQMNAHSD